MANTKTKITLTDTLGGSGPNYKVEWSNDGVNYSESIDCGNISLPSVGSFVTCSIDDTTTHIRLTSLNIFCTNSQTESITPPGPTIPLLIRTTNNTGFDFTQSFNDSIFNYLLPEEFIKDGIPTGFSAVSSSRNIPSPSLTNYYTNFSSSYGYLLVTSSLIGNPGNQVFSNTANFRDTRTVPSITVNLGTIDWASYGVTSITASFVYSPADTEKIYKIETTNNTPFAMNSSSNDVFINKNEVSEFKKDGYAPGFSAVSESRIITGSNNATTTIDWTGFNYGILDITQSIFTSTLPPPSNGSVIATQAVSVNTNITSSLTLSAGAIDYDFFKQLRSVTIINTGSALPAGTKTFIIESQNNTTYYAGTASQDDIVLNRFETFAFTQDEYPSGFKTTSTTAIVTGSNPLNTFIGWPKGPYRLSVTQSLFLDNVLTSTTNAIFDLGAVTGTTLTPGNINYDSYDVIKSVTTINDAPITGSKTLILNIQNNTSESISWANMNFNFQDTPNFRPTNTTSGITPPVYYYISGSEIPVGSSTFTTNANITASFTSSNLIFDIEPDRNNTIQRYSITSSFFTDGTPRTGGGVSSPTSRVNSSVSADINFNPTTWATLSLDITCSYTASAPEPTSSYCYTLETVQSAPGECFDCPGYFASTTDTVMKIFTECSGSEIFPPFDIFVESRYSDNSTSSLFIPAGETSSLIIATSDVQCIPAPECGEDASPTFLSASVVALTGSIVECCV